MIPARAGAGRSIRIAVCGRGRGEEWIGSWERFPLAWRPFPIRLHQRLYFAKKSDGVIAGICEFEKSSVFRVMI